MMHSHTGCICLTFLRCVLSKAPSNHLPERIHICTGCIYLAFLHCVFSNVCPKGLHKRIQSCTGCICSNFLQFDFSNVSLNRLPNRRDIRTGCIYLAFLHCVVSNVYSKRLHKRKQSCIECIWLTFSCVRFQMSSEIACLREGILALVAFIWLVSTMGFQKSVQSGCIGGYKVPSDASFVRHFRSGHFLTCSQTVSPGGGIYTYSHIGCTCFVFSIICFQMCPQMACVRLCKVTFAALFNFSSL